MPCALRCARGTESGETSYKKEELLALYLQGFEHDLKLKLFRIKR